MRLMFHVKHTLKIMRAYNRLKIPIMHTFIFDCENFILLFLFNLLFSCVFFCKSLDKLFLPY